MVYVVMVNGVPANEVGSKAMLEPIMGALARSNMSYCWCQRPAMAPTITVEQKETPSPATR